MFSNKSIKNEKIILDKNEKLLSNDNEIIEVLNNFFSNVIKTLEILQNVYCDLFIGDIDDLTLRATVKYQKHPSILTIKE